MEQNQITCIVMLLILSVAALAVPAVCWGVGWLKRRMAGTGCKKTGISNVLRFSACLIGAVWCLRYAVGYFSIVTAAAGETTLAWWEEIFNSLVHALQTFSMDEDYTAYILDGKNMMAAVFGEAPAWQIAYGAYASVLNFVAPVAGGAIVFEILAGMLPKFRLKLAYANIFRKKYFFSELNAASLALAKDICREKKTEHPVLIFTDAYTEDGSEKDHELLLEAQQYGAICLRDDLVHVEKPLWGKREYYLMDKNEFGNLQALMDLTDKEYVRALKNANIYLFVQSDAYVQIEKQVIRKLDKLQREGIIREGKRPSIVPVNAMRNLVHNLLTDVPLYEPLVEKADPQKLTVTVFGNGAIGAEAFLSIYWFAQMLVSRGETVTDCDLTVNVVSQDTAADFWAKIDYINPEIRQTLQLLEGSDSQKPGDILRYDSCGHKNKPYGKVRYIQADIKIGGFLDGDNRDARCVLGADYFIVALGSDADNISIAQKLRRSIGKMHLEATAGNAVIAYAVFDANMANTLNEHKRYQLRDGKKTDLYMHAFGSLEQVYSCDNIYMSQSALWAEEAGNAYLKSQTTRDHVADHQNRSRGGENSDYTYWANLARAAHIKYKVFSLGWIEQSVFSYAADEIDHTDDGWADTHHKNYIRQCCRQYKMIAVAKDISQSNEAAWTLKQDIEAKKHCLAWLEHRRWNAFARTMGYQHTPGENILAVRGSQKDMSLKLHSCLVEAGWPGMGAQASYTHPSLDPSAPRKEKPLDALDALSLACNKGDFKAYDYYCYEFGAYLTEQEVAQLFATDAETVGKLCRRGCFAGADHCELTGTWLIPEESAQGMLKKVKEGKPCIFRNLWIQLALCCRKRS